MSETLLTGEAKEATQDGLNHFLHLNAAHLPAYVSATRAQDMQTNNVWAATADRVTPLPLHTTPSLTSATALSLPTQMHPPPQHSLSSPFASLALRPPPPRPLSTLLTLVACRLTTP